MENRKKKFLILFIVALVVVLGSLMGRWIFTIKYDLDDNITKNKIFVFYRTENVDCVIKQAENNFNCLSAIKKISLDKKRAVTILVRPDLSLRGFENSRIYVGADRGQEVYDLSGEKIFNKVYDYSNLISFDGNWEATYSEVPSAFGQATIKNMQTGAETKIVSKDLPDVDLMKIMPLDFSLDSSSIYLLAVRENYIEGDNRVLYRYDLNKHQFDEIYKSPAKMVGDLPFEESDLALLHFNAKENWLLLDRNPKTGEGIKDEIIKLDLATSEATSLFKLETSSPYELDRGFAPSISPDFQKIILRLNGKIVLFNIKNRKTAKLNIETVGAMFTPDSNYLVYMPTKNGQQLNEIRVYSLKSGRVTTLVKPKDKNQTLNLLTVLD